MYDVDDVGVIKYVTENRVSRIDSPLLNFLARLQQLFFPESFVREREKEGERGRERESLSPATFVSIDPPYCSVEEVGCPPSNPSFTKFFDSGYDFDLSERKIIKIGERKFV